MFFTRKILLSAICFSVAALASEHGEVTSLPHARTLAPVLEKKIDGAVEKHEGLRFKCPEKMLNTIQRKMSYLFDKYELDSTLVKVKRDKDAGTLEFVLNTPESDTSTVDLYKRSQYKLTDEVLKLPMNDGTIKEVSAVSKKEILLALMQHGRLTEFSGKSCDVEALTDHIAIRQNISAWVEASSWKWPDIEFGGKVKWNNDLWTRGDLNKGVRPSVAFADVFKSPEKYQLACYSMAKIAMAHGMMDYYTRIKPRPRIVAEMEKNLMIDNSVLDDIDPSLDVDNVTAVEKGKKLLDASKVTMPGKVLDGQLGVDGKNWIPGDWGYFLNPDKKSAGNSGYEGSNSIYMGRDKFDDYYHEHRGSYTFREKLEEVYEWRDKSIQKPITEAMLEQLAKTPGKGGIVENYRNVPFQY